MKLKQIDVPHPRPPVFSEFKREQMMAWAVKQAKVQGIPRLLQNDMDDEIVTIVGYGPSLEDTWHTIKPPLITVSGSLNFLISKGMKPGEGWYHCDIDPRPHKLEFITPARDDVTYLMASVCNPATWKHLRGKKVVMWHAMSGPNTPKWIEENDPGTLLVIAGSTVGLCAVHLGGCMGYRHFEIHGFDGSFRNGKRHAGDHNGYPQAEIDRIEEWGSFKTSKIMDNANYEVHYMVDNFPIFCVFHGDGLMQGWIRHSRLQNACTADDPRADSIRNGKYIELTEEEARLLKVA